MRAWLRLFRVVNLPTVPGDVLVGAAAVLVGSCSSGVCTTAVSSSLAPVWWAAAASVFLYAFGLADNDIVGANTDRNRPIPDGEISLGAARIARALCLFAALVIASIGSLPRFWWPVAFALALSIVVYNRTKWSLAMGLCRALSVVCGGASLVTGSLRGIPGGARLLVRVGLLVGGIVYLQLTALIVLALRDPRVMPLMVAGAVLLVLLRLFKKVFPEVSAS